MNYLITGGAGFIGSHLAEDLTRDNEITIVDDLSSGYLENIKHLNDVCFLEKKIQDCHLDSILGDIDGIFHLAAQTSVPRSIDEFYSSSSNNLLTKKYLIWHKFHCTTTKEFIRKSFTRSDDHARLEYIQPQQKGCLKSVNFIINL